jgi:hypothetical protein
MSRADFSRHILGGARKLLHVRNITVMKSSSFTKLKKTRHKCTGVLVVLHTSEFLMPTEQFTVEQCECPWLQKAQNPRLKSNVTPLVM